MVTRRCCRCKKEKPLTEFNKNSKGKYGVHSRCKLCTRDMGKEIYKRLGKNNYLKNTYGITEQDLHIKYSKQNGRCSICNSPIDLSIHKKRSACVDHNHITGEVRDLLCSHCNKGLGMFLDNPELLRNAANYLDKWCSIKDIEQIQSWLNEGHKN